MPSAALDAVRERVRQIEATDRVAHGSLAFGVETIDARLPGGGLARGALHEVAGGGNGAKLNDIDPQAWLADVLARIADLPQNRLAELLPWNWQPDTSNVPLAQAA